MNPNPPSSKPVSPVADLDADTRQWLSAAVDGEAAALDKASQLWRSSEDARATWHRYHLIGDVMRSAELARQPARDAAFWPHCAAAWPTNLCCSHPHPHPQRLQSSPRPSAGWRPLRWQLA